MPSGVGPRCGARTDPPGRLLPGCLRKKLGRATDVFLIIRRSELRRNQILGVAVANDSVSGLSDCLDLSWITLGQDAGNKEICRDIEAVELSQQPLYAGIRAIAS